MQSTFIQPTRTQITFKNPNSVIDFHFFYKNYFGLHNHDFYEFLIMTEGTILHAVNDASRLIKKATVMLVRPGEYHQAFPYRNEKSEHLTISITKPAFQSLCNVFSSSVFDNINKFPSSISFNLTKDDLQYILTLTQKLNSLPVNSLDEETLKISKLIILNLLINFQPSSTELKYPEWLQAFLALLSQPEHFCKRISELYQLAPYSQSFINNHFKKYLGEPIISYITNLRMNYACNLLKSTNFSILYISLTVGYESLAHFNRTFKRIVGVPPAQYRNQSVLTVNN